MFVRAALALFGTWWPGLRYSEAALLITGSVVGQVVNSKWDCSKVAFDGISNPHGGSSGCTVVSIDLILFGLNLWMVALLGAILLFRPRRRAA